MSVHRKDGHWVVRWREGSRQRSRSFPTKREASAFDRDVNQGKRPRQGHELMIEVAVALLGEMNDQQRERAADRITALSLDSDRADHDRDFFRNIANMIPEYSERKRQEPKGTTR